MKKNVNGELVPNHRFVFTFHSVILTTKIVVAYMKLQIKPYIPQPLRCFKCQIFGHLPVRCRSEINKCGVCTEKVVEPSLKCKKKTQNV